jgi:hypothetical protein
MERLVVDFTCHQLRCLALTVAKIYWYCFLCRKPVRLLQLLQRLLKSKMAVWLLKPMGRDSCLGFVKELSEYPNMTIEVSSNSMMHNGAIEVLDSS